MSDLETWAAARNVQDETDCVDGAAAVQRTCLPCGGALVSTGHNHPDCIGERCSACGWGCDRDKADGECARMDAEAADDMEGLV